jgi:ribosomal protein S18 acetylase RimI-like enzyme
MTQCRDDGEQALSLAVTVGNRAAHLYESLGFRWVATTRKLRLPG